MKIARLFSSTIGAVLLIAGCGSSSPSNAGPVPVVQHYLSALVHDDGSTFCSLLTGEVKQRLVRGAAALAALTHTKGTLSCPEVEHAAHGLLGADQIAELRRAKAEVVSQSGSSASVRVSFANGHSGTVELANTAAGWLINSRLKTPPNQRPGAGPGSSEGPATIESKVVKYQHESEQEWTAQLASGKIASVIINKRAQSLRTTLKDGRYVLANYPKHQSPRVESELSANHVPFSVLSKAEAERLAGL